MKLKEFFSFLFKRQCFVDGLEKCLAYHFKSQKLKVQSLTHKSYAIEQGHDLYNERLEFLGDAVLDLCISDLLMKTYPYADEGDLSKMRASLVNTDDLAELASRLHLNKYMRLGSSERRDKGRLKPRLLACLLEAIVGAVYKDGGYKKTYELIERIFMKQIKVRPVNRDYKSALQEYLQKKHQKVPSYLTIEVTGLQHNKEFYMEVVLDKKVLGKGHGKSKKKATQSAALSALKQLGVSPYQKIKES